MFHRATFKRDLFCEEIVELVKNLLEIIAFKNLTFLDNLGELPTIWKLTLLRRKSYTSVAFLAVTINPFFGSHISHLAVWRQI